MTLPPSRLPIGAPPGPPSFYYMMYKKLNKPQSVAYGKLTGWHGVAGWEVPKVPLAGHTLMSLMVGMPDAPG